MPLHKKKNSRFCKIAFMAILALVIILMIISFEPVQNITEVVLS